MSQNLENAMKTYRISLLVCGLAASIAACGDDKDPVATTDATTATETTDTTATTETTTPTDATTATETDTSQPLTCTTTGFTSVTATFTTEPDGIPRINAFTATTAPRDQFAIEFFPPFGTEEDDPLTDREEDTYEFAAIDDDKDYKFCQTCVLVRAGCDLENSNCDKLFYAVEGELVVDEVDIDELTIKATVNDAKLREATFASDFATTFVPNGEVYCIDGLTVDIAPECTDNADCLEAGKGICNPETLTCVGCISSFDCSGATPVCAPDASMDPVCRAAVDECTGDDASEPNDGPTSATALTVGTPFAGGICQGASDIETDWFSFTTTGENNIKVIVSRTNPDAIIYAAIFNAEGEDISVLGRSNDSIDEVFAPFAAAGTYYVLVYPQDTSSVGTGGEAVAYTLDVTVAAPECTEATAETACTTAGKTKCLAELGVCVGCLDRLDCTDAGAPACVSGEADGLPTCGLNNLCTGDDAPDSDDGPAGATVIAVPSTSNKKICGEDGEPSGLEEDWFKFTQAAEGDVELTLAWVGDGAEIDLDFLVVDSELEPVDNAATADNPESIELNGLAAGDYYVVVFSYAGTGTTALAYTLTAAVPAP